MVDLTGIRARGGFCVLSVCSGAIRVCTISPYHREVMINVFWRLSGLSVLELRLAATVNGMEQDERARVHTHRESGTEEFRYQFILSTNP